MKENIPQQSIWMLLFCPMKLHILF